MQISIDNLPNECRSHYVEEARDFLNPILSQSASDIMMYSGKLDNLTLSDHISIVNEWSTLMDSLESKKIEQDIKIQKGHILKRVNRLSLDHNITTISRIIENSNTILAAIFDHPKVTRFGIAMADDLMSIIDERLMLLTRIEDFYCIMKLCNPSIIPNSKTLKNLKALTRFISNHSDTASDKHIENIASLLDQHEEKISRFLSPEWSIDLADRNIATYPPSSRNFIGRFKYIQQMIKLKESTGFYSMRGITQLESGLDTFLKNRIVSRLRTKNEQLGQRLDKIHNLKIALIDSIKNKVISSGKISNLDTTIKLIEEKINNYNSDIIGIEAALAKTDDSLSQYNQVIQSSDTILSKYFESNMIIDQQNPVTVKATDSKYKIGIQKTHVSKLAFKKINATSGSLIRLKVSGTYSPTCALKKSDTFNDTIPKINTSFGPEGFFLDVSQGESKVISVENGISGIEQKNYLSGRSSCPNEDKEEKDKIDCREYSHGIRNTEFTNENNVNNEHFDTSAHFTVGFRSPYAPFYDFPAGSLLAFIMPKGTDEIASARDILVVKPDTQIFVQEDSSIYFVVNDCNENSNTSDQLNITVQQSVGLGKGKELISSFLQALTIIKNSEKNILSEGVDVPRKVNNLIKNVIAKYSLKNGISFYSIPLLRDIFEFWLDEMVPFWQTVCMK